MTEQTAAPPERFILGEEFSGERQDKILATLLPEHSRARLQDWIRDGHVTVDGQVLPPKARLQAGMELQVSAVHIEASTEVVAQQIAFEVVYEDDSILIINKPAGLTVHPGAGQADGTLQNGLLYHRASLANVPRAGIVHRLDKDTSGLMVVAANPIAHTALIRAMQEREIEREYIAIVWGVPVAGSTIDQPLGRHAKDRTKFAVRHGGRDAVTHYRVTEKFSRHSVLTVKLETGRTHQIRVHLQHAGYPIIGDSAYGRRGDPYCRSIGRQALHAVRLALAHPETGEPMSWQAPMPADMQAVLDEWHAQA